MSSLKAASAVAAVLPRTVAVVPHVAASALWVSRPWLFVAAAVTVPHLGRAAAPVFSVVVPLSKAVPVALLSKVVQEVPLRAVLVALAVLHSRAAPAVPLRAVASVGPRVALPRAVLRAVSSRVGLLAAVVSVVPHRAALEVPVALLAAAVPLRVDSRVALPRVVPVVLLVASSRAVPPAVAASVAPRVALLAEVVVPLRAAPAVLPAVAVAGK